MGRLTKFSNNWKNIFEKEKERLFNSLGEFKINEIEHIGATSVVLCDTYGTIDILLSTRTYLDLITVKNILVRKGYTYVSHLSDDFKDIFMVRKNEKNQIVATIHIVEYASIIYQEYLLFKFHLREGSNAKKYNTFRETLLENCNGDIKEYRKTKTEYIKYILKTFCRTSDYKK